jgi:hypothetical protein
MGVMGKSEKIWEGEAGLSLIPVFSAGAPFFKK